MSKTLEISDAAYERIAARAAEEGISPTEYVEKKLGNAETAASPGKTLYDRFAGRLGRFQGKNTNASVDTGKQFTDYVEQKYREGHL